MLRKRRLGFSINGGSPKWMVYDRKTGEKPSKWMIWGCPHLWKPSYQTLQFQNDLSPCLWKPMLSPTSGLKIIKVLYTSRVTFGPWSLKIWHSPCTSTHQKFHRRCVRAERRERCKLWDGSRHNIAWYWIHPQTMRLKNHGMAGHGMAVIRDPIPHPIGAGSQHSTSFYDSKRWETATCGHPPYFHTFKKKTCHSCGMLWPPKLMSLCCQSSIGIPNTLW